MIHNELPTTPKRGGLTIAGKVWIVILVLLAVLAGIFAYRFGVSAARGLSFNDLVGPGASAPTATPDVSGVVALTPEPTPVDVYQALGPDAKPWDGKNRVTVLMLGLDYSDLRKDEGPPRSDTMIVVSFDPLTNSLAMLSIPRDLWVPMPGLREHERINFAYRAGELYNYPGGGPGMAMQAVSDVVGVPIDYYAQVDFYAFARLIDEIQGVKVKPPAYMKVYSLDSTRNWELEAGVEYTLNGEQALSYARDRKFDPDGDFGRAKRTQEVIMSIRDRILRFDMLPTLISKAPTLYSELKSGIRTNLELPQMIQLALLLKDIPSENIHQGVIEPGMTYMASSDKDNAAVLVPIQDEIRELRDSLFFGNEAIGPGAVGYNEHELVATENARVGVYNGSGVDGMAETTASWLLGKGFQITAQDNGTQGTEVRFYVHRGKPYTLSALINAMGLKESNPLIYMEYNEAASVDIEVVLGSAWAYNNPME